MARQIYLIKSKETNEGYVGQGQNDVPERWNQHFDNMAESRASADGAARLLRSVGVNGIDFSYVLEPNYGLPPSFFNSFAQYWRPGPKSNPAQMRLDIAEIYYMWAAGGPCHSWASYNTEEGSQYGFTFNASKVSQDIKKFLHKIGVTESLEELDKITIDWRPTYGRIEYELQMKRLQFPHEQWLRKVVGKYILKQINSEIFGQNSVDFVMSVLEKDSNWVNEIHQGKITQAGVRGSLVPSITPVVNEVIDKLQQAWKPLETESEDKAPLELKIDKEGLIKRIIENIETPISDIFNACYEALDVAVRKKYGLPITKGRRKVKQVTPITLKVQLYNCVQIEYKRFPKWVQTFNSAKDDHSVFSNFSRKGVEDMIFESGFRRMERLWKTHTYTRITTENNWTYTDVDIDAITNDLKRYYEGSLNEKAAIAWTGFMLNGPHHPKDPIREEKYTRVKNRYNLFDTMKGRW